MMINKSVFEIAVELPLRSVEKKMGKKAKLPFLYKNKDINGRFKPFFDKVSVHTRDFKQPLSAVL